MEQSYFNYLMEKYPNTGLTYSDLRLYVQMMGVNSNDVEWLLGNYGMQKTSTLTQGSIMIFDGHAVTYQFYYEGFCVYYDNQNGTTGAVHLGFVYGFYN